MDHFSFSILDIYREPSCRHPLRFLPPYSNNRALDFHIGPFGRERIDSTYFLRKSKSSSRTPLASASLRSRHSNDRVCCSNQETGIPKGYRALKAYSIQTHSHKFDYLWFP